MQEDEKTHSAFMSLSEAKDFVETITLNDNGEEAKSPKIMMIKKVRELSAKYFRIGFEVGSKNDDPRVEYLNKCLKARDETITGLKNNLAFITEENQKSLDEACAKLHEIRNEHNILVSELKDLIKKQARFIGENK